MGSEVWNPRAKGLECGGQSPTDFTPSHSFFNSSGLIWRHISRDLLTFQKYCWISTFWGRYFDLDIKSPQANAPRWSQGAWIFLIPQFIIWNRHWTTYERVRPRTRGNEGICGRGKERRERQKQPKWQKGWCCHGDLILLCPYYLCNCNLRSRSETGNANWPRMCDPDVRRLGIALWFLIHPFLFVPHR